MLQFERRYFHLSEKINFFKKLKFAGIKCRNQFENKLSPEEIVVKVAIHSRKFFFPRQSLSHISVD